MQHKRQLPKKDHKQVKAYPNGQWSAIEVDEGIEYLLEALWSLGLVTRYSCEGMDVEDGDSYHLREYKRAYVMFERDWASHMFVLDLMQNFEALGPEYDDPNWKISYSDYKGTKRITIHFPKTDIQKLIDHIYRRFD